MNALPELLSQVNISRRSRVDEIGLERKERSEKVLRRHLHLEDEEGTGHEVEAADDGRVLESRELRNRGGMVDLHAIARSLN